MVFGDSPAIKQAVETGNAIPAAQLKTILNRIFSRLLTKEDAFSATEKQQLAATFELELNDVQLLVDSLTLMIQTAAYHQLSEKAMAKHLTNAGLAEDHVMVFTKQWANKSAGIIDALRNSGFYSSQLETVAWSLDVGVADSVAGTTAQPNAKLQLGLSTSQGGTESITVAMTQPELEQFYDKLEQIQGQLDALS
ncbi:hypothetical protein PTSG_11178 [Salpingoeca rosetta]|uniref:COMM domain-containing protein n=1 Tax=Salpingoeca rosetta (strain ATCC 50818 / BSB-021) TaxID=946362 RepID=F2USN2_SALR5|nr:uncharacterized protein PTSG_11178 [Salpingoeca rosetta]EGD81141.1 hypothetical protein PTSG_11178 [Salpingoeca rosetta]|eukprot:XP_004987826.1 hypothetical protein PTSG_11178 [Salpingoeca rosetta]